MLAVIYPSSSTAANCCDAANLLWVGCIDDAVYHTAIYCEQIRARPGDALVFHGSLLHRGHANNGSSHRFFYYASFACGADANTGQDAWVPSSLCFYLRRTVPLCFPLSSCPDQQTAIINKGVDSHAAVKQASFICLFVCLFKCKSSKYIAQYRGKIN